MGDVMIELRGLRKAFGSRVALESLDLTVRKGEILGLLGHNGAGKSTAIGMMLGQVWPTAGSVQVCGCDVTTNRVGALQSVGAIFEAPVFYDYLSGRRNLEILACYSGPTSRERIAEVVEWVGLTGREDTKVRTYSHGMRTRLALAQALLPRPSLLILDEPGDGLDPEGIHEMRHTIQRLNRELGLTILLSSHLLTEVEQLCTRIAVLRQGRKVFEGSLSDTRRAAGWVRVHVDNFPAAAERLAQVNLITDKRDGAQILPAPGVETASIVEELVRAGFRLHEIAPEEQNLESFYLELTQTKAAK